MGLKDTCIQNIYQRGLPEILRNDRKKLIANFTSLSILQGMNYILPLVTIPYLVRVLGPEKFGLLSFAEAFTQYFIKLSDFGFFLTSTRKIAINKDDRKIVSEVFSTVMIIKLLFFILSFVLIGAVILTFEKFRSDYMLYLVSLGMLLGNILFPVWFFQGIEEMKYITIMSVISKLFFTLTIFVFIKSPDDFLMAPMFNSMGIIFAGIMSLYVIFKKKGVSFIMPTKRQMLEEINEGSHIFLTIIAETLYTTSNTFILGLLANNTVVGYYSAAMKIIKAIQSLFTPITQTIFPHVSTLAHTSKDAALKFIRKITWIVGTSGLLVSVALLISARPVVDILLGHQYYNSITTIQILAFLPLFANFGNILGIQTMLNFDLKKYFVRIMVSAGVINLALIIPLIFLFEHNGAALSAILVETYIAVAAFIVLKQKGINVLFVGMRPN